MHEVQVYLAPRAPTFDGSLAGTVTVYNRYEYERLSIVFGKRTCSAVEIPVEEDQFYEYLYYLSDEAFLYFTSPIIQYSIQYDSQSLLFSNVFNCKIRAHKKFLKSFMNCWEKSQLDIILKSQAFIMLNELMQNYASEMIYDVQKLSETIVHLSNIIAKKTIINNT